VGRFREEREETKGYLAVRYSQRMNTFTAIFEEAEEGGYTAFAAELPGAVTQGETIEEARENLREAIELVLEANRELAIEKATIFLREPIVV
jgi:predicted RNase H-like HicB family nuclease